MSGMEKIQETHKKIYQVEGMTCTGCERRIQQVLSSQPGVSQVEANYNRGIVTVTFDESQTGIAQWNQVLESEEYTIKEVQGGKAEQTNQHAVSAGVSLTTMQFAGIGVILVAIYVIIENTIGFNFLPEMKPNMSLFLLFTVGLLTSLHCVAMCGGINLSTCMSAAGQAKPGLAGMKASLMYNGGRVISYTIIGGLAGALGAAVSFSGWARGAVAIASGVFMILMGINLLGILPSLRKFTPRLPASLRRLSGKAGQGKGPLVVGLLNGLMPCGPLQAMQLYALGTGSALAGASSMLFFSLGTVPLMLGLGTFATLMGRRFTAGMLKASALMVLILGFVMIDRGFLLSGIHLF